MEDTTDEEERVPESRSCEPSTLHDPLEVGRSYLRYEGETEGRDEELSKREDEVHPDHDPRREEHFVLCSLRHATERALIGQTE